MRGSLLIASGWLVACTSLLGQNSSSDAGATAMAQPPAGQSGAEQGMYVSGFEIINHEKDPEVLGFYPNQVLAMVRSKWYPQIPELQKSTELKRGATVVEFEIKKDGSLGKMNMIESSDSNSLDDVAKQAIISSTPFAHLPEAYHAKALKLQMHFGYNQPASAETPLCDGPNIGAHPKGDSVLYRVGNGVKAPYAIYSPEPEYSEEARKAKYQSEVMVAGTVDPRGAFTDLCVSQAAGEGLDEKAMEAVKTWKFEPATLRGEPVVVRINVEVSFRLY